MTAAVPTTRGRGRATTSGPAVKKIVKKTGVDILTVPDILYYNTYVGREIEGITDLDIADKAMHSGSNVLIEGPTGPGKTSFILAYAAYRTKPFYAVPSSGAAEPSQMFGKWVPDGEGGFHWVDGPVTQIVRGGGVVYISEVNFMPRQIASILYDLLDKRRQITLLDKDGEIVRAHRPTRKNAKGQVISRCWCDDPDGPDCRNKWVLIVADLNPGYEGTHTLNKALRNRFQHRLWWDYNDKVEKSLVISQALVDMAKQFRKEVERGKYTTPVSTNMLQEFEENLLNFSAAYAAEMFVNAFPPADRAEVRIVVNTHLANIEQEIAVGVTQFDGLPDFSKMTEAQKMAWRLILKPGDVDPEWGIFMKDWEWDD